MEFLRTGEHAEVIEVMGEPNWVCRMAELGLRSGTRIQMVQQGTTCLLQVGGCRLCLRGDDSTQIYVQPIATL